MRPETGAFLLVFIGAWIWLIVGGDGTDILRAEDVMFMLRLICAAVLWYLIAKLWDRWRPMNDKDRDDENRIW